MKIWLVSECSILFLFFSCFDRSVFNFPIVIRTHPESNGLLCLLNWKYLETFMCSSLYLPPLWNGNCEGRIYNKKQTRYDPYPSARGWLYCSRRSRFYWIKTWEQLQNTIHCSLLSFLRKKGRFMQSATCVYVYVCTTLSAFKPLIRFTRNLAWALNHYKPFQIEIFNSCNF